MSQHPMIRESMPERVTALEAWVKGHEALCAQRYGDLKDTVTWLVRGVFGMLVAILAWLAIQLWNGSLARLERLEKPATALAHPAGLDLSALSRSDP